MHKRFQRLIEELLHVLPWLKKYLTFIEFSIVICINC